MASTPQANTSIELEESKLFSLQSEKSVVSAALNEKRAIDMREISSQLLATDFHVEAHQSLWRCRTSLVDAGAAHDVTAVIDTAKKLNLFFGGVEYVMSLATDDALASNSEMALRAAARRIKDYSILRTLSDSLKSAQSLVDSGTEGHETVAGFISDSIENIRATNLMRATGPIHIMDYVSIAMEQVEKRLDGQESTFSVTVGFPSLDRMTDGLTDGDLHVIASRPSMGKTAISLSIAEHTAKNGGRDVLYFSTEQGGAALAKRMIASNGRVDATSMKRGEFGEGDFDRMIEGSIAIAGLSMWVDETSEITLPEIKARSRIFSQQRKEGRKMVIVVDYLQRIASHRQGDRSVDQKQVVSEISTGLKNLAKELRCPVVALAQLNRTCETRANKRPMMSDLGESGKIEQDADIVMFLYRDEYYNPATNDPGITEVIVAKNREGAVGFTKLAFEKRTQRFTDISAYD